MTAEEPLDEAHETEEAPQEAGGKGLMAKLKLPLIIVVVLIVIAVVALVVLPKLTSSGEDAKSPEQAAADAAAETKKLGVLLPLDPFIVNLMDPSGKRYLKVRIELELSSKELETQITERMPQIKDGLLILLSSKTYEDIETVEGKLRLRQELVARINSYLSGGRVQNIYFTEFVVQ